MDPFKHLNAFAKEAPAKLLDPVTLRVLKTKGPAADQPPLLLVGRDKQVLLEATVLWVMDSTDAQRSVVQEELSATHTLTYTDHASRFWSFHLGQDPWMDRYIMDTHIPRIATTDACLAAQKKHIFVLWNLDRVATDTQKLLRRMLERTPHAWFICTAHNSHSVDANLMSRFSVIHLRYKRDMSEWQREFVAQQRPDFDSETAAKAISLANGDPVHLCMLLELPDPSLVHAYKDLPQVYLHSWLCRLSDIKDVPQFSTELTAALIKTGVPFSRMAKQAIAWILEHRSEDSSLVAQAVEAAAQADADAIPAAWERCFLKLGCLLAGPKK